MRSGGGALQQKAVLFNGGNELEVAPVQGANEFLSRILGGAPAKHAIPALRLADGANGERLVAVFLADTHVGYLPPPVDPGLVTALEACDQSCAVARVRGKLLASWETPGEFRVKIDLAEPSRLLGGHTAEPLAQPPESPETLRARAEAAPMAARAAQPGWLGATAHNTSQETAPPVQEMAGHRDPNADPWAQVS